MFTYNKVSTAVLLACLSSSAMAIDPAALDFDGIQVTPTVEVAGTHDSNYLATPNAEASWITSITPAVNIAMEGDKSLYQVDYILNHKIYHKSGAENLTNHSLKASADFNFDVRNNLSFNAGLNKTEDAANAFTAGELNAFTTKVIGANYVYGAPSATGNVELGFERSNKRSDNDFNLDQENDVNKINAGFIYKATAKTKLTAEVISSDYDYVDNDALDSRNTSYLFGARWEATAKTTGYARIGKETKDFDNSGQDTADSSRWEVNFDWAPKTYSVVTFKTSKLIDEGTYGAEYTKTNNNEISWNHDWGRGYTSHLSYSNIFKDYSTDREDTIDQFGVGLKYEAKRWLDFVFNYNFTTQDSTDNNYDYDRDIVSASVNLSL